MCNPKRLGILTITDFHRGLKHLLLIMFQNLDIAMLEERKGGGMKHCYFT